MFEINYNKLINWLLPKEWRKTKRVAFLQALIAPLKFVHTIFKSFINTVAFEMKITGQVIKLRYGLNEKFDHTQRRIIIRDGSPTAQVYTFLEVENKPVYMPFYIGGSAVGFEVVVPMELRPEDVNLRGMINKFKLPGTTYNIIYL
jgi:hypothetical protein